ncbi:MAG: hypothetical protein Q9187_004547 [Circinaria calcarea]
MLDPLTALSLAAAIIQFVDWGSRLLSQSQEIYHSVSGATEENVTTKQITSDIKALSNQLKGKEAEALRSPTADDIALRELADSCQREADKLLIVLHELEIESTQMMAQLQGEIEILAQSQAKDSDRTKRMLNRLLTLAEEGRRIANEERLLKSLKFDEWKRRFTTIDKAHNQTFEWIFEDSDDSPLPKTHFKMWLRSQNGIYWISGKAGSGKSTLIKFLCTHPRTREYLQQWAGPDMTLIVADWYFWSSGSPMQRSQEGLLQSLLYQILIKCPELIPIVCSTRWGDNSAYDARNEPWTREELSNAFDAVACQTLPSTRFCLFVDGLDEYDGLPSDIIRVLTRLANSPSIKLCLSSRPWNEFEGAFGDGRCDGTLSLHRFTRRDIERFVRDILETDESFSNAERNDPRYKIFVQDVIDKANGVFLWVQLVVTSILKGLGERNKLEDLQKKLNSMPKTLGEYFRKIFNGFDEAYQKESAQIFLLTTYAVQPLSVALYQYLRKEEEDSGYALKGALEPLSENELFKIYEEVRERLNFLCKDLLEVNKVVMDGSFVDYRVDFLHRTVRDFLMTKDIHGQLLQRATDDGTVDWNAYQSLCKAMLVRIKSIPLPRGLQAGLNFVFTLVDELMFYAFMVEKELKASEANILEALDSVVETYAKVDMADHWTNARDPPSGLCFEEEGCNSFLALTIQARLQLYVTQKLDSTPKLMGAKRGRPLLDYALRPNLVTPTQLPHLVEYIDFKMVDMLLNRGSDANQKVSIYDGITVWGLFLLSCYQRKDVADTQTQNTWYQAAELMIRKGADRRLKLETTRKETITKGDGSQGTTGTTAKYKRPVTYGNNITTVQIDVPVVYSASELLKELFGGRADELNAIISEKRGWSIWDMGRIFGLT